MSVINQDNDGSEFAYQVGFDNLAKLLIFICFESL